MWKLNTIGRVTVSKTVRLKPETLRLPSGYRNVEFLELNISLI